MPTPHSSDTALNPARARSTPSPAVAPPAHQETGHTRDATWRRNGRRTILFLAHSASRNGASILLLHLLQWLRANSDFCFEVLCNGDGPLVSEFRAVAPTRVWRNPVSFLRRLEHPWADALPATLERWCLRAIVRRRHHDLIYVNTAAAWNHAAALASSGRAILWHIHELPYAIGLTVGDERARGLLTLASRVVAVSEPVADSLTRQYAVAKDRVDLVHGFVPIRDWPPAERRVRRQRILDELGWPQDSFVVGACGGPGWRKGSDLFLQIASRLQRSCPDGSMRFLWVGGGASADAEALRFAHDLTSLRLSSVCCRVASTADVDDYYCAMDLFALTSREDPFPLVMLEAGVHGVPTVCFANAGGGPEFVADDAGRVVAYLDLDGFARAIEALQAQPALRETLGLAARRKVQMQYCVETQGPKLLRSIERCLARS